MFVIIVIIRIYITHIDIHTAYHTRHARPHQPDLVIGIIIIMNLEYECVAVT